MFRTQIILIGASLAGIAACASAQVSGPPVPPVPPVSAGTTKVAKKPGDTTSAASAATPVPGATPAAAGLSTLAGVYSDAQATRGEDLFNKVCLSCHVPTDYEGDAFVSKFVGGTVFDMFDDIRSSMPQDNPGSLTNEQYADVVTYIFKLNGLPTRSADLPPAIDSMKLIKVEAKPPSLLRTLGAGIHHGSSHIR